MQTIIQHSRRSRWLSGLLGAAMAMPLLTFSQPAAATDLSIRLSSGHGHHGYHHKYRTRSGFALGYGVGGHFDRDRHHGKHYKHYRSPNVYYYGRPYAKKKVYPSRSTYGYYGHGRSFDYYHDNARRYSHDYKHGFRDGYSKGHHDHDGRHKKRHKAGGHW